MSFKYALLFVIILIFVPLFASTQTTPSILINELLYDPAGTDTGKEWIELYNTTNSEINLKGWKLEWGGTKIDTYSFTFPTTAPEPLIGAHQFVVVGDDSSLTSFVKSSTKSFYNASNRTDGIRLVDNEGKIVDVLLYGSPNTYNLPDISGGIATSFAPAVSSGYSLARYPDGFISSGDSRDFVECTNSTFRAANSCPSPTPTTTASPTPTPTATAEIVESELALKTIINEALPNPEGNDEEGEFIELYNPNDVEVNLEEYKIDDAEGSSSPYNLPAGTVIAAKNYLAIYRTSSKITLNNDKDSVRFLDPSNSLIDEVSYDSIPTEGAAFALKPSGEWEWTMAPTSGKENIFMPIILATATYRPSPSPKVTKVKNSPTPKIKETRPSGDSEEGNVKSAAKKKNSSACFVTSSSTQTCQSNKEVIISGIVSAEPGSLQEKVMFIMNPGMGVFLTNGEFPKLNLGDLLKISGEIKEIGFNKFLVVNSPENIKKENGNFLITPQKIVFNNNNDFWVGSLVSISGRIESIAGRKFTLEKDLKKIIVNTPGIISSRNKIIKSGNWVKVVGILSKNYDGYHIFTRVNEDITLADEREIAKSKMKFPAVRPKMISAMLFFLAAALIYIFLKPNKKLVVNDNV